MAERRAEVYPTKAFFIDMLTRDINLDDAMLDLVDNSIDAYIRSRGVNLMEAFEPAIKGEEGRVQDQGIIDITIDEDVVEVADKCGGIDIDRAESEMFRIGVSPREKGASLGVYGIGLKRALFKLGKNVLVESRTRESGFRVQFNVDEWGKDEEDWSLPLEEISGAEEDEEAGARVRVSSLRPEIAARAGANDFLRRLEKTIGQTYGLFMDRFVKLTLNGREIEGRQVRIAASDRIGRVRRAFEVGGVNVVLLAGLAERVDGSWEQDRAGWYVMCNGRVVVSANKDQLTGWGEDFAQFVPKFRGFVGVALFSSSDPSLLPWTTTKSDLNEESEVYRRARDKMIGVTRQVLAFLNEMYPRDIEEEAEPVERELAEDISPRDLREDISDEKDTDFTVEKPAADTPLDRATINFKVRESEIDRVRKALGKPRISNAEVGRQVFQYFLAHECQHE